MTVISSNGFSRIVSIANQKGGVGKTTTSVNLAASLAHLGQKTLLIDLDPQGNASSGLGLPKEDNEQGVYDVLMGDVSTAEEIHSIIKETNSENLYVLPATRDLLGVEVELTNSTNRETRLKSALKKIVSEYQWVILDCPPSLGFLTINALTASDGLLVPVQSEYYALEGLGELLRTLSVVRKGLNPQLKRDGILLTMHDGRNNLCGHVEDQVREVFGSEVFDTVIPRNVRLGEAPSYGCSVLEYDPFCAGAVAYLDVTKELLANHSISIINDSIESQPAISLEVM